MVTLSSYHLDTERSIATAGDQLRMVAGLAELLSVPRPPAFVYLHHPHHTSCTDIDLASVDRCLAMRVDAIECHTPRLLYSTILDRFRSALGVEGKDEAAREVTTWDELARGMRTAWQDSIRSKAGPSNRKSTASRRTPKGKEKGVELQVDAKLEQTDDHLALIVTHAERLSRVLGYLWSGLTRMKELVGIPISVVMCSQVPWDELRPFRADALEPVHVYRPPPSQQDIVTSLLPSSPHPLFPRFLDLLVVTALPLLPPGTAASELHLLASALWPIYTAFLPPHAEQIYLERTQDDRDLSAPPLQITLKLLTDLKAQIALPLQSAIESLLTRQVGRSEFTAALQPRAGMAMRGFPKAPTMQLPELGKYLVVAAYCGSYNPAKSDLRLFGRGVGSDARKKKGGGTRRAGYGRVRAGKVPQRLLGPKPFPLDRLLALFAALYGEHAERPPELQPSLDAEYDEMSSEDEEDEWRGLASRDDFLSSAEQQVKKVARKRKRESEREERWEDEVWHLTMSAGVWSLIPELEAQGMLKRVSPPNRLDNVMMRCALDYEGVKSIARELKITLDEYIYEQMM